MSASELFQHGKLREAIEAATADVKKRPTDIGARSTLCQMLCFAGDLERADSHLDAIVAQDPDRMMTTAMTRQLIRAELARRQLFDEGRVPEFIGEPTDVLRLHLQATLDVREGNLAEAARRIDEADDARPPVRGTCDGKPFDALRDLDDLTASLFEVLTSNGKYFWIPTERIETIELHKPESPFDLVWRRVHMQVKDGPDGEVFLPVLYVHTYRETDDALRLGRATDWRGADYEPVRGVGQRVLLVGDDDRSILDIGEIEIDAQGA